MPIKFEIYRDGARVTAFEPVAAMAVGPESVPIPGDVHFRDGILIIYRRMTMRPESACCGIVGRWAHFILKRPGFSHARNHTT